MTSKTRATSAFQRAGWVVVSLLLLISAGLPLFARQALGQVSVATILLALYLARWSYVLGLVGLLFLSVRCLLRWRSVRIQRAVMSQYSPAEPRSRYLEKLELRDHQCIGKDIAPVVPSRSSRESDDRNKATVHPESPKQIVRLRKFEENESPFGPGR